MLNTPHGKVSLGAVIFLTSALKVSFESVSTRLPGSLRIWGYRGGETQRRRDPALLRVSALSVDSFPHQYTGWGDSSEGLATSVLATRSRISSQASQS